MMTFEFRLVLDLQTEPSMEDVEALYEAGCSDATFGSGAGLTFGDFDREAESLEQAIRSAIADVQRAGFQVARVEQVEQSLITTINSELASLST